MEKNTSPCFVLLLCSGDEMHAASSKDAYRLREQQESSSGEFVGTHQLHKESQVLHVRECIEGLFVSIRRQWCWGMNEKISFPLLFVLRFTFFCLCRVHAVTIVT